VPPATGDLPGSGGRREGGPTRPVALRLLPALLRRTIRTGTLTLLGPGGFRAVTEGEAPGPRVTVRIHDPRLDWKIPLNPQLAVAEAFIDGTLTVEDGPEGGRIADLIEIGLLNRPHLDARAVHRVLQAARHAGRRLAQHNPVPAGRAQRRPPLRPRQRLLPPLARRGHAVLLRLQRRSSKPRP
jgi:hypothetical protein